MEVACVGSPKTFSCPEYTPPSPPPIVLQYEWYKQDCTLSPQQICDNDLRVAVHIAINGEVQVSETEGDLAGRGSISGTDGSLTIDSVILSDQHAYTCIFPGLHRREVDLMVYGKHYILQPININMLYNSYICKELW